MGVPSIIIGVRAKFCMGAQGEEVVLVRLGTVQVKGGLVSVLIAGLASAASAQSTSSDLPHTSWGAPDLQGFWTNTSFTTMQRREGVDKLVLSEEEAAKLANENVYSAARRQEAGRSKVDDESSRELLADKNPSRGYNTYWMDPGSSYALVKGEYRSSWITHPANGRIPYSEAGIRENTYISGGYEDIESRPLPERCIMSFTGGAGPVMNNGMYNNTYQIVQTPTSVAILTEMIHDVRIIPIDGDHNPDEIPKWGGDSVGHYEGDTLVVETINSHPEQRSYISSSGKVVERYSRWSEDEIFYEFEVQDPTIYTQNWGGEMVLRASDQPLYEYACHEGNYALPGVLAGARKLEREGRPHPPAKAIFAGVDVSDGE